MPGPGLQQGLEPFLRLPLQAIPVSDSPGSAHRLAASTKAFSSGEEA